MLVTYERSLNLTLQYYTKEGMPTRHLESNVCAVCGNKLLVDVNEEGVLGE